MKLSFVMMVKNESKHLEKVLQSMIPIREKIPSEVIVLDTGSTDNTVEIARKYTDKVFFHEWNDDFAYMRNKSISFAKGEWLLIIDGDEVITNPESLIQFFHSGKDRKYNTGFVHIKSIVNYQKQQFGINLIPRLFKNRKDFRYVGKIHEQPVRQEPSIILDVTFEHYGYLSTDKALMERKFKRNRDLLLKELKKDPDNVYTLHHLSQIYGMHKDYKEALMYAKKAYETAKRKHLDLSKMMYIYTDLTVAYINNKKFSDVERICQEAIRTKDGLMDFYFYLASVEKIMGKTKEAIVHFEKYIYLVNHAKEHVDITITNLTISRVDEAYYNLFQLFIQEKEYEKIKKYLSNMKDMSFLSKLIPLIVHAYVESDDLHGLKEFADRKCSEKDRNILYAQLEAIRLNEKDEQKRWQIAEVFSDGNDQYSLLNKIRMAVEKGKQSVTEWLSSIEKMNFSNLPNYYGDIIYYLLQQKYPLYDLFSHVHESHLINYIKFLSKKYTDLNERIRVYIDHFPFEENLKKARIHKPLLRFSFLLDRIPEKEYAYFFQRYLQEGKYYVKQIYHPSLIEEERIYDVNRDEDQFFIFLLKAEKQKGKNEALYIRYLRKALEVYPAMKKGIELLLTEVTKKKDELQKQLEKIKGQIDVLLTQGLWKEALSIIEEALKLVPTDADLYSIQAVIFIQLQRMEEAKNVLEKGLEIDPTHVDCLYNLAYLKEQQGETKEAIQLYKKVLTFTDERELKEEIERKLREFHLKDETPTISKKKKILYLGWLGQQNIGDEVLFQLFEKMFKRYSDQSENVQIDAFSTEPGYQYNVSDYDLVVLGGGSLLHIPYWLNICTEAINKNIPVVSWGTGIDGFFKSHHLQSIALSKQIANQYRNIFEKFDYLSVRGPFSKNALLNIGVKNTIDEIGDPALIYADEFLKESHFEKKKNHQILINWGTSYNNVFGKNEQAIEQELVKIAKLLISKGYSIVIYPIWKEDIPAVLRLGKKINDEKCQVISEVYDAVALQKLISESYMTINFKLHANILSASANVPFISLAYRGKCIDFAKTVDCLEYTIPTDVVSVKKIVQLVEKIERNYDSIVKQLNVKKQKYNKKIINSFKIITSILTITKQKRTKESLAKMGYNFLNFIYKEGILLDRQQQKNYINQMLNSKNKEYLEIFSEVIQGYVQNKIPTNAFEFYLKKQFNIELKNIKEIYQELNLFNKKDLNNIPIPNQPKVSIIITTLNRKTFLEDAIKSILQQVYSNLEIIVIDDCSTDGTELMMNKYLDNNNIKYIRNKKNIGPGDSRRRAFEKYAEGEYILFLDDDDYLIDKYYISKAVKFHQNHPEVSFVAANVFYEISEFNLLKPSFLNLKPITDRKQYFLNFGKKGYPKPVSTLTAVFKRDSLIEMGILDMSMVNDASIYLRSLIVGDAGFINEIVGVYRIHGSNITFNLTSNFIIQNLEEKMKIQKLALKEYSDEKSLLDDWLDYNLYTTIEYFLLNSKRDSNDVKEVLSWCKLNRPNVIKKIENNLNMNIRN